MISLPATWVVTVIAVGIDPPESINRSSTVLFALSGLVAPGVSRLADLTGVQRLGPSISVPLQSGTRPLLSVIGGVVLLGEEMNLLLGLGVVAIVLGLWNLSRRSVVEKALGDDGGPRRLRSMLRPGIVFPIVAGTAFAVSDVLKKEGLASAADPTFGAMVAIGSALVFWMVATLLSPRILADLHLGPGSHLFLISGVLTALALISLFHALDRGNVSVVGPITSSSPLVIFALSALFLRDLETITRRTVLSGAAVVLGGSFVAAS